MPEPKHRPAHAAAFVDHAFSLARSLGLETVLVLEDEVARRSAIDRSRTRERIVWITRGAAKPGRGGRDRSVAIPDSNLSRMAQIRVGLYAATWNGYVGLTERVLCLSGAAQSRRLDMMLVTRPKDDFPWIREEGLERTRDLVNLRDFGRLLELSLRFAAEGREGKPIGTTFVIGDGEELSGCLRQLILNPCAGHPTKARSIHNPEFIETLRELSAIDGAVVVNRKGIVESAGTYLDAPVSRTKLRPGWGARHAAAASITTVTDSLSFVVSESSGSVTVFDDGRPILELDRPQSG